MQKFLVRDLASSIERSKVERARQKIKQSEDIKQSLKRLTECVIQMTREMKEKNQNKSHKDDELKPDQTQVTLKHLTECVIQMTKEMKQIRKESQKLSEKITELKANQRKVENQLQISQEDISLDSRMEKRFQNVDVPIPILNRQGDEGNEEANAQQRKQLTFEWITKICKAVFSIGFNLYESGVLDINKVKAYCSENLIRNFIKFSKINNPTPDEVGKINDFLVEDLLPYFCLKYPESEEAETSTKFSSGLIERDDLDNNDYDLVYKSGVDFSYQENGNYNSQIMKFLNYIISLPEKSMPVELNSKSEDKKQKPLGELFFTDVENIFRMVETEENVIKMHQYDPKNPKKAKKQKLKTEANSSQKYKQKQNEQDEEQKKRKDKEYREKVILYTSFQIGQKLSKNLKLFSNSDIESGNLTLKSADIIRVLTKWCEELERYYKEEYFYERDAPFRMKDGSQKYLNQTKVQALIERFAKQSTSLEKIKKDIRQNNNKNQSLLMGQEIYQRLVCLSESEAVVGQFSSSIFKNNITYLISYLNALIHGICKAIFSIFAKQDQDKSPQLISFSIGDLMRCKCSSKENEIIALYKQIERRHRQPDSGIKIIRVKNRLNKGNKDILMNLLYRGEMVVEMQLVIKSDKSKFIQCSYNFNHYLYELRRAQFGPIMEMCNIWMNKDLRGKFYLEQMEKLNVRKNQKLQLQQNKKELLEKFESCCRKNKRKIRVPFKCSLCECFFSASSLLQDSIECKKCQTLTCYLCQLQLSDVQVRKLVKQIPQFQNQEIIPYQQQISDNNGGVLVNLKSKKEKPVIFITSEHKKKFYMFEWDEDKQDVNLVQKLESQQIPASFLKEHLVLTTVKLSQKTRYLNEISQLARQNYFTMEYLKEAYKAEKSSISIKSQELNKQMLEIQKIDSWPHVVKLNFSSNSNLNLQKIMEKFPNVQVVVLNSSQFQSALQQNLKESEICKNQKNQQIPDHESKEIITNQPQNRKLSSQQFRYFQQLKQLEMSDTNIQEIPNWLSYVKSLLKLNISGNSLSKLPSSITSLVNLESLDVSANELIQLPQQFGKYENLKQLNISKNQFTQLPTSFTQLKKLQKLNISSNIFQSLPENFNQLQNLQKLWVNRIKLKEVPESWCDLHQLTQLSLVDNQLVAIPNRIGNLKNLKILNLRQNQIEKLPESIGNLKHLQQFYLRDNKLKSLPEQIGDLVNLNKMILQKNQLSSLPQKFGNLVKLEKLYMRQNQLKSLPVQIGNLVRLKSLYLRENQLSSLPQQIGNLVNLQILDLNNNQLTHLPQEFQKLSKLNRLVLTCNKLESLPEFTKNFPDLKILHLNYNKLKQLPISISYLKSIQNLNIRRNEFTQLPEIIREWQNLKMVDFRQNKHTEIPSWLFALPKLNQVYFSVMNNLNFPLNLAQLRNQIEKQVKIQIEYLQEYQELAMQIQSQSSYKILIDITRVRNNEEAIVE